MNPSSPYTVDMKSILRSVTTLRVTLTTAVARLEIPNETELWLILWTSVSLGFSIGSACAPPRISRTSDSEAPCVIEDGYRRTLD